MHNMSSGIGTARLRPLYAGARRTDAVSS